MGFQPNKISFDLPKWLESYSQTYVPSPDRKARMKFVIGASKRNVELGTGGPFAAAVFEVDSWKLVSLGVNLVTTQGMSILHAEIVALSTAQRKLGHYDLGAEQGVAHELVTSAEPCAMCLGAIPWSGVHFVVSAARDADVSAIGFDEGAKPDDWVKALTSRGITVIPDVERDAARAVFQLYLKSEQSIYNARSS